MTDVPRTVDFPESLDPTPKSERESAGKFSTSMNKSLRQIGTELERFDVDEWIIDDAPMGSGQSWPGVVVRWTKDNVDYALVSDTYTTKKANARAAYYWIHETRKREQRPVTTANDPLAAAALPPGEQRTDSAVAVPPQSASLDPHEVLGVEPNASPERVERAYRSQAKERHADSGGSTEQFMELKEAKEAMLDE